MMRFILASLAMSPVFIAPGIAEASPEYVATEIPTLPGYPYPRARSVNNSGHFAGTNYTCPYTLSCLSRAVLFDGTFLRDMSAAAVAAVPPGFVGLPSTMDLNDADQAVFRMAVPDLGIYNYYWDAQQTVLISGDADDDPGAPGPLVPITPPPGIVWAMNNNGTVLGTLPSQVFLWERDAGVVQLIGAPPGFTTIGARGLNVHGHVTGGLTKPGGDRAYLWAGGTFTILDPLPGDTRSTGLAVNDDGYVVGTSTGPDEIDSLVTWHDGAVIDAVTLDFTSTLLQYPLDINAGAQVAGYYWPLYETPYHSGFDWMPGSGFTTLTGTIVNIPGLSVWAAEGVNDAGQLAVWGDYPDFTGAAFILDPVVDPGTPGDLDGDGIVGIADFLALLGAWGPCDAPCPPSCVADLDGDCAVGIADFLTLLANWDR